VRAFSAERHRHSARSHTLLSKTKILKLKYSKFSGGKPENAWEINVILLQGNVFYIINWGNFFRVATPAKRIACLCRACIRAVFAYQSRERDGQRVSHPAASQGCFIIYKPERPTSKGCKFIRVQKRVLESSRVCVSIPNIGWYYAIPLYIYSVGQCIRPQCCLVCGLVKPYQNDFSIAPFRWCTMELYILVCVRTAIKIFNAMRF
jgi:hypothetical protein